MDVTSDIKNTEQPTQRTLKKGEYVEGRGRRKRSSARVRIFQSTEVNSVSAADFDVNGKKGRDFFQAWQYKVTVEPLEKTDTLKKLSMSVHVTGGGITGQAEAVRMGLSRALIELEPSYKSKLRRLGYLTRDPREKERKKYGLKKARRAPQFSKR